MRHDGSHTGTVAQRRGRGDRPVRQRALTTNCASLRALRSSPPDRTVSTTSNCCVATGQTDVLIFINMTPGVNSWGP
jgi:hypothetical protein